LSLTPASLQVLIRVIEGLIELILLPPGPLIVRLRNADSHLGSEIVLTGKGKGLPNDVRAHLRVVVQPALKNFTVDRHAHDARTERLPRIRIRVIGRPPLPPRRARRRFQLIVRHTAADLQRIGGIRLRKRRSLLAGVMALPIYLLFLFPRPVEGLLGAKWSAPAGVVFISVRIFRPAGHRSG
jgi:hypothetical protein